MQVANGCQIVGLVMVDGGIVMGMVVILLLNLMSLMVLHIILISLVIWLLDGNLLNRIGIISMHLDVWSQTLGLVIII